MKVLVAVSSKHGATGEIARSIGEVLRTAGFEADVTTPESVETLADYDAVVLGSAIYAGRWLEPAKSFAARFEADLKARPVFLFSSGPLGDPPKPSEEPADMLPMMAATGAVDHRIFAGRLDPADLSLPERLVVKVVRAPGGDFIPWDDVASWASEIVGVLNGLEQRAPVQAT